MSRLVPKTDNEWLIANLLTRYDAVKLARRRYQKCDQNNIATLSKLSEALMKAEMMFAVEYKKLLKKLDENSIETEKCAMIESNEKIIKK